MWLIRALNALFHSMYFCRLICESDVAGAVVNALHSTAAEPLAMSYLDVLMHMSSFSPTAQQLCGHTNLLAYLPKVMDVFNITIGSPLLPCLLEVLWNMLDAMPEPRTLPAQVCCCRLSGAVWSSRRHASVVHAGSDRSPK